MPTPLQPMLKPSMKVRSLPSFRSRTHARPPFSCVRLAPPSVTPSPPALGEDRRVHGGARALLAREAVADVVPRAVLAVGVRARDLQVVRCHPLLEGRRRKVGRRRLRRASVSRGPCRRSRPQGVAARRRTFRSGRCRWPSLRSGGASCRRAQLVH
eukprot:scaffold88586_cov39-Phaeocystis_antarctica.AAC.1